MATSACHRVFEVLELREQILLYLPLNELLRSLSICTAWAESTRIRQALFLVPTQRRFDLEAYDGYLRFGTKYSFQDFFTTRTKTHAVQDYIDDFEGRSWLDSIIKNGIDPVRSSRLPVVEAYLSKGPVMNPFITAYLHADGRENEATFCTIDDDVKLPRYLVWQVLGYGERFERGNASWRQMQVMQPSTTKMGFTCRGGEVNLDENHSPQVSVHVYDGQRRDYFVTNPNGVTLGEWVHLYQRHLSYCAHCVVRAGETQDHYGERCAIPFERWQFSGGDLVRKLRPDSPEESVKSVPGNNRFNTIQDVLRDPFVVPGSGFTGHYVLSKIAESLPPVVDPSLRSHSEMLDLYKQCDEMHMAKLAKERTIPERETKVEGDHKRSIQDQEGIGSSILDEDDSASEDVDLDRARVGTLPATWETGSQLRRED